MAIKFMTLFEHQRICSRCYYKGNKFSLLMENPGNHFIDSYESITLCNNSTLQKHERCFNQLWLHRF